MQLLLNWKEIIVRDKYITDPAELSKPLSSREDAWNFIIEDLKRATSLPATRDADNVGRATSGSAYAYLGFAYLTRAYEEATNKDSYLASAIEAFNQVKDMNWLIISALCSAGIIRTVKNRFLKFNSL